MYRPCCGATDAPSGTSTFMSAPPTLAVKLSPARKCGGTSTIHNPCGGGGGGGMGGAATLTASRRGVSGGKPSRALRGTSTRRICPPMCAAKQPPSGTDDGTSTSYWS
eukprot:scaffold183584_cov28-Tisochrysis_lutea.AAC.5